MDKIKRLVLKLIILIHISFCYIFLVQPNIALSQDEPLQIDIMGGNIQAMPIAISYFSIANNLKELQLHNNIPDLIANNLVNSGLFKLLNRDAYMQDPDQLIGRPKFRDWRIIDAQALITGKITKTTNDKINVTIELWDVYGEKRMFGISLSSKIKSWRRISHIISDKIYERLTGEEGYFDTRIVYVSESGSQKNKIKRLAIMDQDGSNHQYLTDGKSLVLTPRFSHNQQQITFFFQDCFRSRNQNYMKKEEKEQSREKDKPENEKKIKNRQFTDAMRKSTQNAGNRTQNAFKTVARTFGFKIVQKL